MDYWFCFKSIYNFIFTRYSVLIIKFSVVTAPWNLVLLSSMMFASSTALVVIKLVVFFSTLLFKMMLITLAMSHIKGSLNLSSRFTSSKITCCGVKLWTCFLSSRRSHLAMVLLWLQWNMAWTRLQVWFESQRVQTGLVTLTRILDSLSWVGRMLWTSFQMKE